MMPPIDFPALKQALDRSHRPEPPSDPGFRSACVFLLLVDRETPHLLAIQKKDTEGYPWRNQVALPGGYVDPGEGPEEAVFRELREELSIPGDQVSMVGSLGHFQTINHTDIQVFLGIWSGDGPVRHDTSEIARVLEIPVTELVQTHFDKNYHQETPDIFRLRYPYGDVVIWGATARILHHFITEMGVSTESWAPPGSGPLTGADIGGPASR